MQPPQRYIAHFDLDSFFVSVEILNDPRLKGKPVIVGGSKERGVVSTCSYEARKFGVRSGMSMKEALRLCPQAELAGSGRRMYSKYSQWVTDIIAAKAPLFEKASIDEFYIDLSGMERFHDPYAWSIALREEIIDKTQLPISFGLSTNKLVAKIATGEAKPNGYLFVRPGQEQAFLAPLAVGKMPGVGENLESVLKAMGITTIGDILGFSSEALEDRLGKWGPELLQKAKGIHNGTIAEHREAKSISTESTFMENLSDRSLLEKKLVAMTEKVGHELRMDKKICGSITVKIRYPDFETHTKQAVIPYSFADADFIPVVLRLFDAAYKKGRPVRLLGVKLGALAEHALQTNLFEDGRKKADLYKAIDAVKEKFGKLAIQKARTVDKPKQEP